MAQTSNNTILARIIIVAFNSADILNQCLAALQNQTSKNFEVVIVNNSAEQPVLIDASALSFPINVITPPTNIGFAAGCNLGAKGAETELLIMLNPDAFPDTDWFEAISSGVQKHQTYDFFSCTQLSEDRLKIDGAGDCYSIFGKAWRGGYRHPISELPEHDYEVMSPCGASAVYKRHCFEDVGGFDEDYFCYLEDIDLGLRLQFSAYKCMHLTSARLVHISGASSHANEDWVRERINLNEIRLILKLFPAPMILLLLPAHFALLFYSLIRSWPNKTLQRILSLKLSAIRDWKNMTAKRQTVKREIGLAGLLNCVSFSVKALRKNHIVKMNSQI